MARTMTFWGHGAITIEELDNGGVNVRQRSEDPMGADSVVFIPAHLREIIGAELIPMPDEMKH